MKRVLLISGAILIFIAASAQTKIDSLLQLCKNAPEVKKADLYLEMSFDSRGDSAKSNEFNRMAFQLAVKNKQLPKQAKAYYYFGETSFYTRDFVGAIPHYEAALVLFEQLKDTFQMTNCINSVGICYQEMYQGERAIEQYVKGLKLCERDQEYAAELLSNIAMVHQKMQNYRDAISYYKKASAINTAIKDTGSLAVNYNGLGNVYNNMDKPDSAILNFNEALYLFKKVKRTDREAIALTNLASNYVYYKDSLNKAMDYLGQAWNVFRKIGWEFYEPEIKQGIASIYSKQGNYNKAINLYNESLQLTDHYNRGFELQRSNYAGIYKIYESMGDYKSALKYYILSSEYNDSLVQKEKYEQVINLEKQYETEKKENEITQLQAQQAVTEVQLNKNKQLKLMGFFAAALLLGLVMIILWKYFDKIKSNQMLEEKNRVIEHSEAELRILNAAKNKFFSIIAHDLKNPLHAVIGYSYLLSKDYDRFSEQERRKFAQDIHHSTDNIFRLLQNLLEWSRSQTGKLTFTPLEVEFKRVLGNSIGVLQTVADQKKIKIQVDYNEQLKLYADPQMIETVLRNLINNAIKFTPENGVIDISARQSDGQVEVCVHDNGIGIPETDRKYLFRIDSKIKRKGTNEEDGSGLGLILCKEFVDKNNGTIWVESEAGKGSSFFFTIPALAIA